MNKTLKGQSAEWFDTGYGYRQRIPISNAGSGQTDYQVGITLNTSSLISASKMQSDCDDIRFTAENGETLSYWIEENNPGCNQTNTRIWVKVPSIPGADINIYLYYGNTNATAGTDGNKTFLFFDDFNNGAIDYGKWITDDSTSPSVMQEIGSTLQLTAVNNGSKAHMASANRFSDGTTPLSFESKLTIQGSTGPNIRNRLYLAGWNRYESATTAPTGDYGLFSIGTTNQPQVYFNAFTGTTIPQTQNIRIIQRVDGTNFTYRVEDAASASTISNNSIGNTSVNYPYIQLISTRDPSSSGTSRQNFDWVFVRKFATTEPTIGTFGTEEVAPGPIGYWKMDEGYGSATDNSTDGTAGTITGAVWQNEDMCIRGKCLYFDGTDDIVDTGKDFSWAVTDSFSMSGWVNMKRAANGSVWGKGTTGATWEYKMSIAGSTPQFVYFNTSGSCGICVTSSQPVEMNQWNHLAVTYDGVAAEGNLYVNGELTNTQIGVTGTLQNRANNLNIGRAYWSNSVAGTFPGMVDELRIFDYERTAEEIKTEYISGASGKGAAAVLGATQDTLNNGLVGYWKMDETTWVGNNAVLDSSGNNVGGTAVGGAGITAPGKFGNGGIFDGVGDYVSSGSSPTLDVTDEFTVSVWAKASSVSTNAVQYAVAKTYGTNLGWGLGILGTYASSCGGVDGTVIFANFDDNSAICSTVVVDTTNWYQLTATHVGDSTKLYVNGVLTGELSSIAYVDSGTPTVYVGSRPDSPTLAWVGSLDEARIYTRAFSPREVSQLYEWAPGPIGNWSFNENVGGTAFDTSGVGATGILNGPVWTPGKYGSGLDFDGNDYVNTGDVTTFDGWAAASFMSWVKFDRVNFGSSQTIMRKWGDWNGGVERTFFLVNDSSTDEIQFGISTVGGGYYSIVTSSSNLVTGRWYHVAAVWDGGNSGRIYIDGISQSVTTGSATTPTVISNIAEQFSLGASYNNGSPLYYLDGALDEARIYNYARSAKQIVQDMNGGHPAVGSPVASAIVHYKMDEGYGATINNSGNAGVGFTGNFATGTSAPTWTNDGKFGKALSFDGTSDYVSVPALNGSSLNSTYTISAWALAEMNGTNPIVTFGNDLFIQANLNDFRWQVNDSSSTAVSCLISRTAGQWYHYVVVSSGVAAGQTKLYLNGVECGDGGDIAVLDTSTMQIGRQNTPSQRYWKGSIDEVKVYNYPLSADEVKAEYNQGKAIVLGSNSTGVGGTFPSNSSSREYCVPGDSSTCDSPVSEWLFNENVGATTYDTSGNANIGNFGTGLSTPTWAPGKESSGVLFDGTGDLIDTSNELSFSSATSFTVSGWIKPSVVDATSRYVLDRTTGTNEIINIYTTNTNSLAFRLRGDDGVGIVSTTAPSILVKDQWLYFAGVRDVSDDTITLFVNGKYQSKTTDTTTGTNSPIIRIGNHSGAASGWLGIIDQLRIYDYARTPAQIAWEYNKGAPIIWLKMDECQGSTINNSVPTPNGTSAGDNGTLTITASGSQTSEGTCSSGTSTEAWNNGTTGKRGASLSFDGTNDYVTITDSANLDVGTKISYAAWIKPTANDGFVFNKWTSAAEDKYIYINTNNTVRFYLYNVMGGAVLDTTRTITMGEWSHVVGTYDGTTATIYINGKYAASKAASGNVADSTGDLYIGESVGRGGMNNDGFPGQIDDFRIYNYDLTAQQVKTIYNNGAVNFE